MFILVPSLGLFSLSYSSVFPRGLFPRLSCQLVSGSVGQCEALIYWRMRGKEKLRSQEGGRKIKNSFRKRMKNNSTNI
jgi:hypothetical protein